MGQFGKIASVNDLPDDPELDRLIREAADLSARVPRSREVKHAPAEMHPDFAHALDRNPAAKAVLDSFPPGARRDYVDWIADSKRDDTRSRRIAQAIEWLAEGRKRNWKYESR